MAGSADLIGVTLGAYELQALLGSGGMARVYRALDRRLQRQVAVKVLSADAAHAPGLPERFLQEARLIASLRHPNIVQVYDFGEQSGYTFMVQELLAGPTLAQQLAGNAARGALFPREQVIEIVRQLAAALDAAHAAGIIHRDVKPGNAIWNDRGALVLTDFGIAKSAQMPNDFTQAGMVVGTPDYLSPEQARNLPLTPSSDIYSLGVLLYELLAGQPPFHGDLPMAVVLGHMQDAPPPLRSRRPDLPPAAERVVLQALAKSPEQRFRSAGALAGALEGAWPATPAAAAGAPALHDQTTRVWASPARPATPIPVAPAPAPESRPVPVPPPRQPAPVPAARPRRSAGGCLLVGLLLLGLLGVGGLGAAMLLGRGAAPPPSSEGPVPTVPPEPSAEAPVPTDVPIPTEAPLPTEAPPELPTPEPAPTEAPLPTETPAPTLEPTPEPAPTEAPAELDPSVGQLRELLLAGQADGRAGKHANQLVADGDAAAEALLAGNTRRATDRLRDLQRRIDSDARDDQIDIEFARQALDSIDEVARAYKLKLPTVKLKR